MFNQSMSLANVFFFFSFKASAVWNFDYEMTISSTSVCFSLHVDIYVSGHSNCLLISFLVANMIESNPITYYSLVQFSMRALILMYFLIFCIWVLLNKKKKRSLPYSLIEFLRVHKFEVVQSWDDGHLKSSTSNSKLCRWGDSMVILFVCSFPLVFQVIWAYFHHVIHRQSNDNNKVQKKKKKKLL